MRENDIRDVITQAVSTVTDNPWSMVEWEGSTSLRELGVSSLMVFQLVSVLETLGGFTFDDTDIDSAHFNTLNSVAELLSKYSGGRSEV